MNGLFSASRCLATLGLASAILLATTNSHAADFTLSGKAAFHNDVVQIDFSVNASTAVRLWTDSWLSGTNFDPYLSLFGSGGALVASNDDANIGFGTGPGYYDAGLSLSAQAGSYRLTLTAAPNSPNGARLQEGFAYDADAPIAIGSWNQPSYDINTNDQKGTFWRVQLQGVDQAGLVPEPTSLVLLLAGLAGMSIVARRQR